MSTNNKTILIKIILSLLLPLAFTLAFTFILTFPFKVYASTVETKQSTIGIQCTVKAANDTDVTIPIDTYYKVTFNSAGGTIVPMQFVKQNEYATEPIAPTRANYEFKYWTEENKGETTGATSSYKEFKFTTTPITHDITLTAVWTPTPNSDSDDKNQDEDNQDNDNQDNDNQNEDSQDEDNQDKENQGEEGDHSTDGINSADTNNNNQNSDDTNSGGGNTNSGGNQNNHSEEGQGNQDNDSNQSNQGNQDNDSNQSNQGNQGNDSNQSNQGNQGNDSNQSNQGNQGNSNTTNNSNNTIGNNNNDSLTSDTLDEEIDQPILDVTTPNNEHTTENTNQTQPTIEPTDIIFDEQTQDDILNGIMATMRGMFKTAIKIVVTVLKISLALLIFIIIPILILLFKKDRYAKVYIQAEADSLWEEPTEWKLVHISLITKQRVKQARKSLNNLWQLKIPDRVLNQAVTNQIKIILPHKFIRESNGQQLIIKLNNTEIIEIIDQNTPTLEINLEETD